MRIKNLPSLLFLLFVILFIGDKAVLAQENDKKFIILEVKIAKERHSTKVKVPLTNNSFISDGKTFMDGEIAAGGLATVDCLDCGLSSEYDYLFYAIRTTQDSAKVNLSLNFKNKSKCNIKNTQFLLERGISKELKLKCGVKITAKYE